MVGRRKRDKNPELCFLPLPPIPDGEMITENQTGVLPFKEGSGIKDLTIVEDFQPKLDYFLQNNRKQEKYSLHIVGLDTINK